MKRLILLAVMAVLSAPLAVNAMEWHFDRDWDSDVDVHNHHRKDSDHDFDRDSDRDGDHHGRVSATEMNSIGLAAAAFIGVGGYLALRRRNATQN